MKFKCVDELNKFGYADAEVDLVELSADTFKMTVSGLISKYNNPCNNRYQDCYIREAFVRFTDAKIIGFIKEGMKCYDANDVLLREVPDTVIEAEEYEHIFKMMTGSCFMYGILDKGLQPDGRKCCEIGIDIEDEEENCDTYWVEISYNKFIVEWDRYAGKVGE